MKPSLCIINYNGMHYLKSTLIAAVECSDELEEIIVFDNASDDGSPEMAEREFPDVKVVRLGENRGPAPARNAALVNARSDRILIIDNDVQIAKGSARIMSLALDDWPETSIAMPSVIYAHRPDVVQYDGADNHFLGQQIIQNEDRPVTELKLDIRQIGSLISACFMVDRNRLPEGLTFDESFFIYFEDHDFGVRARLYGSGIISVPEARCYHSEGTQGLSLRQLGHYSTRRVVCLIRNRWLFLAKTYSMRTLLLLAPLLLLFELAQLVVVIKKGWFREWWQAVRYVASHLRELAAARRDVQARRVVPDREIMRGGAIPFRPELVASRAEAAALWVLDTTVGLYWRFISRVA